jgi:hypothetical protein
MVYYFNGRKLQIGLSTHETDNEKVIGGCNWILNGVTILVSDCHGETIETTNGIDVLCGDWIIILESDGSIPFCKNTRKRAAKVAHRRLTLVDIRGSIIKNGIQLLDRNITMLCIDRGVDTSGEKSSLNNIFERLLEIASESVRTILSDRIDCHSVILIVEIGNSLSGGSNESHL